MAIQKLGIQATCSQCGEQQLAGDEKDLAERRGWTVIAGKSKRCFCSVACEVAWGQAQLKQNELLLEQAEVLDKLAERDEEDDDGDESAD